MSHSPHSELLAIIDQALSMTVELRKKDQRAQLFEYADQQLQFMRNVLISGRAPTEEEKQSIGVGRMAITYFENGPNDNYADILERAAGGFISL